MGVWGWKQGGCRVGGGEVKSRYDEKAGKGAVALGGLGVKSGGRGGGVGGAGVEQRECPLGSRVRDSHSSVMACSTGALGAG
uniref:Uncharacterized protein n=1 Tax=Knipowitschia caucasica TaxID=637954 RepID=A0AAV2LII5_KNICA